MLRATDHLAYLTADTPGTGGLIKVRPEDFLVDEQPLYQACGEGEHLYLFIEKREQTTTDVQRRLAKMFGVRRSDVAYAGLKDKHAITRQHFSIYLPDKSRDKLAERIQFTKFKLLWAARHTNKLRKGHLAGNRFVIRIRQIDPSAVLHAKRILDRVAAIGAPNYIGDQRFGYRQTNQWLGKHLVKGEWKALLDELLGRAGPHDPPIRGVARRLYEEGHYGEALKRWARMFRHDRQALDALRQGKSHQEAVMAIDPVQREFMISSLQSAVFNEVLHHRIRRGFFDTIVAGDLAWKHDSRAVFAVDEATAALENAPGGRMSRLELSPSGPMWGRGMIRAAGQVEAWEREPLADFGLTAEEVCNSPGGAHGPGSVEGTRRPMRIIIKDHDISGGVDEHGSFVRVAFELPRGCFATMVLREVMKPCRDAPHKPSHVNDTEPSAATAGAADSASLSHEAERPDDDSDGDGLSENERAMLDGGEE